MDMKPSDDDDSPTMSVAIENARLFDAPGSGLRFGHACRWQAVVSPGDLDEILSSIIRTMILVGIKQVLTRGAEQQAWVLAITCLGCGGSSWPRHRRA
jgi:hypothetical protein